MRGMNGVKIGKSLKKNSKAGNRKGRYHEKAIKRGKILT
jgi:hypothetical protein